MRFVNGGGTEPRRAVPRALPFDMAKGCLRAAAAALFPGARTAVARVGNVGRIVFATSATESTADMLRPSNSSAVTLGVPPMQMTHDAMMRFAEDWAAAWNRRDVDAVLAHFAE